ncbi:putative late blight resistance protein homolog R1B-16 [Sesamum indicum]|uniref:Late blight resistance protein homolog R1B-16 n=1 Tax=Sesamum indicum TaxID=4182 RepID=A0A6I9SQ42_SESIN|nr:putative late blight resistance protein homolog R1B-16 [Sesamum indicum]
MASLAQNILFACFNRIQFHFPIRIWVYVSQEFTRKDIFLTILRSLTGLNEDMYRKSDQELARLVAFYLENRKFLIVMDDVWTPMNWEKLQIAPPKSNITVGKFLITTPHLEVAQYVNQNRPPHNLRFLTQEESWLLLCLEVFGKRMCPPELEDLEKLIANQCDGLPLAVVVIGDILVNKNSDLDDMSSRKKTWAEVSKSVSKYLSGDPERRMEKTIALSYDDLPRHLKACFLYLGMFPKDFEIPAWKLICMWIAEGFIQEKFGINLEETTYNYLEDLINRNLVRVEKRRPDSRVKTCRIHVMLRDFCIKEAGNERENFLQEMERSIYGFEPSISELQKFRRLCIHSSILNFISFKPYGPRALPTENASAIPAAFKLLRVLEVNPIKFTRIPADMYQLVQLRYLSLSINLAILPEAFSKLWNIQTLITFNSQHLKTPSNQDKIKQYEI